MGEKVTFSPTEKIIYVTQAPVDGLVEINVQIDLYSDGKEDWLSSAELIKYDFPIRAVGGDPLPGSKELGRTYFITPPWRIKPYEANHTLRIIGNLFMEDGSSAYTSTDGTFTVNIESQVSNLVDSTIAQLEELEYSSYQNAVWVDTSTSYTGTDYPAGTRQHPVNNIPDAVAIGNTKGFSRIGILSNLTLTTGDNLQRFELFGINTTLTHIVIETGADVFETIFRDMEVEGILDGGNTLEKCYIHDLTYFNGTIRNSTIEGTITLGGGAIANIYNCFSGVPGSATPTIDMGGTGQSLAMRAYSGGIKLINKTGPESVSLDFISGQAKIDSTVSNGTIVIRGNVKITDEHTGTANVDSDSVIVPDSFYNDGIWIDNVNGTESDSYPTGLYSRPVKGNDNAVAISNRYGVVKFNLIGGLLIDRDFLGSYIVGSTSITNTLVQFDAPGYDFTNSRWERLTITGTVSATSIDQQYENCVINDLGNIQGMITESSIGGTLTTAGDLLMRNVNAISKPTIVDISGAPGATYQWSLQTSPIQINGMDATSLIHLNIESGQLILDSSCTGGTVKVHGNAIITDNSGGAVTIEDLTNSTRIADDVWDESITAAAHNIPTSAGRKLRQLASSVITEGEILSATINTASLNGDSSEEIGAYDPSIIVITDGTGYGQSRGILEYDNVNHKVIVDRSWKTIPDATSKYVITTWAGREHINEGLVQGAGSSTNTIILNELASSYDNVYVGQTIFIRSGTGEDQACKIINYNGTTKEATISKDWWELPDNTSAYSILPTGVMGKDFIADAVWDEPTVDHQEAGSTGEALEDASNLEQVSII